MQELDAQRAEDAAACGFNIHRLYAYLTSGIDQSDFRWANIEPVPPKPQPEQ
jgi:hypothetical protein